MMRVLPHWRMALIVDALTALRGIEKLSAMTLLAELGDISHFQPPWQRRCGHCRILTQVGKNTKLVR